MRCPLCGSSVELRTPDYGYGYGTEYACYGCDVYGRRYSDHSEEAKEESNRSRGLSASNAGKVRGEV
jgi:hypothetical protein